MDKYQMEAFQYAFDEFWRGYWKENTQPEVLNMAMKEIGRTSWNAAIDKIQDVLHEIEDGEMPVGTAIDLSIDMKA